MMEGEILTNPSDIEREFIYATMYDVVKRMHIYRWSGVLDQCDIEPNLSKNVKLSLQFINNNIIAYNNNYDSREEIIDKLYDMILG